MANVNDVLGGHVALVVECVDRLLVNAYVPGLQMPGQVVRFLTGHRGHRLPSPALMGQIEPGWVPRRPGYAVSSFLSMSVPAKPALGR